MTSHQLARMLLRQPDLPVHVVNDDYSRSDVIAAKVVTEIPAPGAARRPAAIALTTGRPDWED